jgi:predicted HTH domain antitoxin
MQVTLNIPDELAEQIVAGGGDISRAALELLAIEGYRSERLSESEIRRLLGFETRMEVHAFLKEHSAWLHYSLADLEQDRKTAKRMRDLRQPHTPSGERIAG